MIRNSHGQYSSLQIQRCSQMSGPFKKDFRCLLRDSSMAGDSVAFDLDRDKGPRYDVELEQFVDEYKDSAPFDYCPPRAHKAFPDFVRTASLKTPHKLGRTLKCHSANMDLWTNVQKSVQSSTKK